MALEKLPKISGGSPSGGAAGQVLVKSSGTDYDYAWANIGEGFDPKASVKARTNTPINLATGGLLTVDTYATSVDDRILVASQTLPEENGIYLAKSGAWVRSADADTGTDLTFGAFVFVENGSAPYISTGWVMTTAGTINLGTTPIVWTQFSQAGVILAGAGLTKSGNTIDITDPELVALMNTTGAAADRLFYFDSATTGQTTPFTSFARTLLDDTTDSQARGTLNAAHTNGDAAQNFSALTSKVYDNLVLPKTSGFGIQVDTTTPTFGWRDLLGEIRVDEQAGANKPTFNAFVSAGNKAYQFLVNDQVYLNFHLPHDYVPGTDLYIHAHWAHNSAAVTTGAVTWDFECTYAKGHDQAAFTATTTLSANQNASTTQYRHMIAEIQLSNNGGTGGLLDSTLIEADGLIMVRTALSANTMSAATDPFLLYVDIHYQSTNIATKNKAPNFWS